MNNKEILIGKKEEIQTERLPKSELIKGLKSLVAITHKKQKGGGRYKLTVALPDDVRAQFEEGELEALGLTVQSHPNLEKV